MVKKRILVTPSCLKKSVLRKKLGLNIKPDREYNITGTGRIKLTANNSDFSGTVFINAETLSKDICGTIKTV